MTAKDKVLNEALTQLEKHSYNGIIIVGTGGGKGRIMIEAAKILKPKNILYTCDNSQLRDHDIVHEFHKWDAAYMLPHMERLCYQSAHKLKGKHYDLLLADEFDYSLTPVYKQLYENNTFTNKILVSATLEAEKRKLGLQIAPIVYEKFQREMIHEKVLNPIRFYFINYKLTEKENARYLEYNKRYQALLNPAEKPNMFLLNNLNIQRKQWLSGLQSSARVCKWLLHNLDKPHNKTLVFCGLTSQADKVCKHAYHGGNEEVELLQLFDEGAITQLAVVDKINRGKNIHGVNNIIHESMNKGETKLTQRTGRGLRLDVNQYLNVFFLIPHFLHPFHGLRPTIVMDWVKNATQNMDLTLSKTINFDF